MGGERGIQWEIQWTAAARRIRQSTAAPGPRRCPHPWRRRTLSEAGCTPRQTRQAQSGGASGGPQRAISHHAAGRWVPRAGHRTGALERAPEPPSRALPRLPAPRTPPRAPGGGLFCLLLLGATWWHACHQRAGPRGATPRSRGCRPARRSPPRPCPPRRPSTPRGEAGGGRAEGGGEGRGDGGGEGGGD